MVKRIAPAYWGDRPPCSAHGDPYSNPLGQLERAERQQAVNSMVNYLSPALAETLRLRFIKDLPPAEVAMRTGCSRETLKKRLTRAKRSFAEVSGLVHNNRRIHGVDRELADELRSDI